MGMLQGGGEDESKNGGEDEMRKSGDFEAEDRPIPGFSFLFLARLVWKTKVVIPWSSNLKTGGHSLPGQVGRP
jgi:hypothetical protein